MHIIKRGRRNPAYNQTAPGRDNLKAFQESIRGGVMEGLLQMPSRTYSAKLFDVPWESAIIKVAGTLDGFIDLAMPGGGTYPLSLIEAGNLAQALIGSVSDVRRNCLHGSDPLLMSSTNSGALRDAAKIRADAHGMFAVPDPRYGAER